MAAAGDRERRKLAGYAENRSLLAARCSASQLSLTVPTSIHDRDLGLRQSRRPSSRAASATPRAAKTNGNHIWSISNDSRFAGRLCTARPGYGSPQSRICDGARE